MTDMTQGQDAPNENDLFNEAVTADTLEKFENPEPVPPQPPPAPPPKPGDEPPKPEPKPDDNAPVPPGRLREEADARRRAERERDAAVARVEALLAQQQPRQSQPQPQPDLLDNPPEYVRGLFMPVLEQMNAHYSAQFEAMSKRFAIGQHGREKVDAAFDALSQGMRNGDPVVKQAYDQIMVSPDRWGAIVEWHQQRETNRLVGGDIEAFKRKILEEALTDPEYRKRAIEAAKGQAAASGNTVARPVVASSPSLGNIGAAGGDTQIIEPSDAELFRQATSAKRR